MKLTFKTYNCRVKVSTSSPVKWPLLPRLISTRRTLTYTARFLIKSHNVSKKPGNCSLLKVFLQHLQKSLVNWLPLKNRKQLQRSLSSLKTSFWPLSSTPRRLQLSIAKLLFLLTRSSPKSLEKMSLPMFRRRSKKLLSRSQRTRTSL